MEAKLWFFPVLLTFVFAGLSVNLFLEDTRKAPSLVRNGLNGEQGKFGVPFPSTAIQWFGGMLIGKLEGISPSGNDIIKSKGVVPLSPNLSTCHRSLSDGDLPVSCCLAMPDDEHSIPDFKFPDPSSPLRIRKPAHLIDRDYVAKYEKAVAIMKQLDSDHPHNFLRQAKLYCAYNQPNSTALLKIHRSWLFFPWHRIFVYFHERILGKLIGDDTFALPYWNWDSPSGMTIPGIYMKGSLNNMDRDRDHLPPHIVDINKHEVENDLESDDKIARNLALMYNQMVSGASKPELFMGCKIRSGEEGACDGPGTIEQAPHYTLQKWVGSGLPFYSAARDPMFYAHHANIDRLWTVWKKMHGDNPEFVDSEWLDSYFYLYDEHARLVRVKVRDCLDTIKLRYQYEEAEMPWLNLRPKPSVPPKIAREILKMRDSGLRMPSDTGDDELMEFGLKSRSLDKIIRVKVQRPKRRRTKKEKEEEEEVLVVFGIDVKKDMYVKFDVFVNAVDETITSPRSREFAGTFVYMWHGTRRERNEGQPSMVKSKSSLKLGISELLGDLEADEDESIWVSLVPRGGIGVDTTISGIRIEYMR